MYSVSQYLVVFCSVAICIVSITYHESWIESYHYYFPQLPSHLTSYEEKLVWNNMKYILKREEKSIQDEVKNTGIPKKKRRIAVCCSADLDVSVSATALMKQLETKVSVGKHHERIRDAMELQESFSYYFGKGAAAEQSTTSLDSFKKILSVAENTKGSTQYLGGNAATIAQRAAYEGCDVLLGAAIGDKMKNHLHPNIQLVGHLTNGEHEDVHLSLEYQKGEKWNNYISPRANRYYLNHDVHNSQLSSLEAFEEALDTFNANIVVIGGIQLMEADKNESRRISRLQELSTVLQHIYVKKTPSHLELAAVSDFNLFNGIVNFLLPWINSIGLNEQELHILHHYLITGEEAVAASSEPSVYEVTKKIEEIIAYVTKAKKGKKNAPLANLERLHFHTLQFHIICQKKNSPWDDPSVSLSRGLMIGTKLGCGKREGKWTSSNDIEVNSNNTEILLTRRIQVSINGKTTVSIDPHSPITKYENGDFDCHLAPMLVCKEPDHTTGLGDNISGIGLTYHEFNHKE